MKDANDGQMSLFAPEVIPAQENPVTAARVYRIETTGAEIMDPEELFGDFDEISVITYSYSIDFLEKILSKYGFRKAKIIFGSGAIVDSDKNIAPLVAEILTTAGDAGKYIKRYPTIVEMMRNGRLSLRVPRFVTDHRKLYILHADDGRTRVISGSANLSRRAWSADDQMETYEYDDTALRDEKSMEDFDTMWDESEEIPYEAVIKKPKDILDENPAVKKIVEANEVLVVSQPSERGGTENARYLIEHRAKSKEIEEILKDVPLSKKMGRTIISARNIKRVEDLFRKKAEKASSDVHVPSLTYDLETRTAFIGESVRDLSPVADDVRNDIEVMLEAFSNYNPRDFLDMNGNLDALAETHFKLLNLLFSSPFHAVLRHELSIRRIDNYASLPLFAVISSETAGSGKTFMITLALKLMTGKKVIPHNKSDVNSGTLRGVMASLKGCPFFVDEINTAYVTRDLASIIKNDYLGTEKGLGQMPMVIMAGNDITPDEALRRRMPFFSVSGALRSEVDKSAFKTRSNALLKKAKDAFYRLYTKYMMEEIVSLLSDVDSRKLPDDWYPDITAISSKTILRITEEFGYMPPMCIRELAWNEDYVSNVQKSAVHELIQLYHENKKAFRWSGKNIIINFGTDTDSWRRGKALEAALPTEMMPKFVGNRDECILYIRNADEFARKTGIRLRKGFFR